MDGFPALNRYIVERSPHRRFQPNAGPMTADPDGAARRRSLAVASLPCFHSPEHTAVTRIGAALTGAPMMAGVPIVIRVNSPVAAPFLRTVRKRLPVIGVDPADRRGGKENDIGTIFIEPSEDCG